MSRSEEDHAFCHLVERHTWERLPFVLSPAGVMCGDVVGGEGGERHVAQAAVECIETFHLRRIMYSGRFGRRALASACGEVVRRCFALPGTGRFYWLARLGGERRGSNWSNGLIMGGKGIHTPCQLGTGTDVCKWLIGARLNIILVPGFKMRCDGVSKTWRCVRTWERSAMMRAHVRHLQNLSSCARGGAVHFRVSVSSW